MNNKPTLRRNGAFIEFWLNGACIWSVNLERITTHQDLAVCMAGLADDFDWFGNVQSDFERLATQHLNRL